MAGSFERNESIRDGKLNQTRSPWGQGISAVALDAEGVDFILAPKRVWISIQFTQHSPQALFLCEVYLKY